MIHINKFAENFILNLNYKDLYFVIDFDRTITSFNSNTTWDVLKYCKNLPKEFSEEFKEIYTYYRPIELNNNLNIEFKTKLMEDWYLSNLNCIKKHKLLLTDIYDIVKQSNILSFRDGVINFFNFTNQYNIPVIIISAGVGNVISAFLHNRKCKYKNVYIISNFITFSNNMATGLAHKAIHTLNKNTIVYSNKINKILNERNNVILIGDLIADIKMIKPDNSDTVLKIGFLDLSIETNLLDYKKHFDIVATNNCSFNEICKLLFNKY